MKYIQFFFAALCAVVLTACDASDEQRETIENLKKYPKYEEVATEFFTHYKLDGEGRYIAFAKKPDGWYAVITAYDETGKIQLNEYFFWSLESESYQALNNEFVVKESSGEELEYFLIKNMNAAWYANHFPYHGYQGYEDATIELLDGIDDLNDTLTHALANAYYGKTQWVLGSRTDEGFVYKNLDAEISDDSLGRFMDYAKKSLELYQQIVDRNPAYETWVGTIKTKISNDAVGMYAEMDWRNRANDAKQLLEYVNYPNSVTDFAHNILAGCDSNGIVFTNGDNDTFPLWYLQSQGFRTDVAVVNLSLINVAFYVQAFKEKYDLQLSIPADILGYPAGSIVLVDRQSSATNDLSALAGLYNEHVRNVGDKEELAATDYFSIPSIIQLKLSANMLAKTPATIRDKYILDVPLTVDFGGTNYVYLADWIVLNLMLDNDWKRPMYIASTVSMQNNLGFLKNHVTNEGMVYKLNPFATSFTDFYKGYDTEKVKYNLANNYQFSKQEEGLEEPRILANSFTMYLMLADALQDEGKSPDALHYLDEGIEKFPIDVLHDPVVYLFPIQLYAELNEAEKVKKLVKQVCTAAKEKGIEKYDHSRYLMVAEILQTGGFEQEAMMLRELVPESERGFDQPMF